MQNQAYRVFPTATQLIDVGLNVVNNGETRSIPIFEFIRKSKYANRTILVVEWVSSLNESSANNYPPEHLHREKYDLDMESGGRIGFDSQDLGLSFPDGMIPEGQCELNIISFLNTPLIGKDRELNEEKRRLIQFSELLVVYVVFCKSKGMDLIATKNSYIYESYNHLGFIVTERNMFNEFIIKKLGRGRHNLINKFTMTEIADELFKSGLMVLCWGITPWVYMITSQAKDESVMFFPQNSQPACSGEYIFLESIKDVSVIPGPELLDWDTDHEGRWPTLAIEGVGNVVQLDLYVVKTVNPVDGSFIPVPYFNLTKKSKLIDESTPILDFNILGGD